MLLRTWRGWVLVFGFCTFMGLLSFSTFYSEDLLEGQGVNYSYYLINELTAAYSILLLLPFLIPFIEKFPFTRANWYARLPVHFLASIVFGFCHTTLMSIFRMWLYPLAGLDPYKVGNVLYRYVMEYQKQLLVYGGIVLAVHVFRAYRERREKEQEAADLAVRTAELQTRLADARLQALRNQLNPHFLFNTLNMISSLMYEDVAQADRMIARLSQLLRMSLEQADRFKVPLQDELGFLEAYLEIMRCRFSDRVTLDVGLDSAPANALVPSFLLQPLAENTFKHGGIGQGGPLEISLKVLAVDDTLEIEMTDNGAGIGEEDSTMQEGHGISNVRRRLEELYSDRHVLEFGHIAGRGFRVHIVIPLEFEERDGATSSETGNADENSSTDHR